MSDPARLFQSLHLDDMPVTRSQSRSPHLAQQQQQQQRRRTLTPRGRGRGRGRGQPPIPLARPTRAHSGIQYDTQVLSPTSSQHAVEGLQSVFVVNRVEKHEPGPDNYYVFQLSKPVEVSIHDPAGNAGKIYECTCDVFRNTQAPCPHIYVSLVPGIFVAQNMLTITVVVCWPTRSSQSRARSCCTDT